MSSGMSTVPCIRQLQLYDTYKIAGFCNIFVVFKKIILFRTGLVQDFP